MIKQLLLLPLAARAMAAQSAAPLRPEVPVMVGGDSDDLPDVWYDTTYSTGWDFDSFVMRGARRFLGAASAASGVTGSVTGGSASLGFMAWVLP